MPQRVRRPTAVPPREHSPEPRRAERREDEALLIPARMLNEFVYCPRLAYLEWVQKEWESSSDTVEGRHVHRRVDARSGTLPEPDDDVEDLKIARSVELSSPTWSRR